MAAMSALRKLSYERLASPVGQVHSTAANHRAAHHVQRPTTILLHLQQHQNAYKLVIEQHLGWPDGHGAAGETAGILNAVLATALAPCSTS